MKRKLLMAISIFTLVGMANPQCASAATYAYSIGVNHGTQNSGDDGDFTPNVTYAKNAYATISNVVSTQLLQPVDDTMLANNPNGNRMLASKIVFLNGHANYSRIRFNYNNNGGIYDTGVTNGYDGGGNAGLKSIDMSTCKVISFMGCQTGNTDYTTNLVRTAVAQGANTAVGFKEDVTTRSTAGKNWLKKYNDSLASGNSVSVSIRNAVDSYPNSDLSSCAIIAGRPTQAVASVGTETMAYSEVGSSQQKYSATINISTIPDVIKDDADNTRYSLITDEIERIDSEFDASDYKVSVNRYEADTNSGVVIFVYYINGTIETNKAYICTIKNNVVTEISTPVTNVSSSMSMMRGVIPTENQLTNLVAEYEEEQADNALLQEACDDIASDTTYRTEEGYVYDYNTNTLIHEVKTFYEDQDGVICDGYYSEELY